jgi:hypothetical protein
VKIRNFGRTLPIYAFYILSFVILLQLDSFNLRVLAQTLNETSAIDNETLTSTQPPLQAQTLNETSAIDNETLTPPIHNGTGGLLGSLDENTMDILVPVITAIVTGGSTFAGTFGITRYTGRLNKELEVTKKENEKEKLEIALKDELILEKEKAKLALETERNRKMQELILTYDQDLRKSRIDNYKVLWNKLSDIKGTNLFVPPSSPDAVLGLTVDMGRTINNTLEQWYYTNGGFYMTDTTRAKYDDLRKYLSDKTSSGRQAEPLHVDIQKEVRVKIQDLGRSLINEVRTNEPLLGSGASQSSGQPTLPMR